METRGVEQVVCDWCRWCTSAHARTHKHKPNNNAISNAVKWLSFSSTLNLWNLPYWPELIVRVQVHFCCCVPLICSTHRDDSCCHWTQAILSLAQTHTHTRQNNRGCYSIEWDFASCNSACTERRDHEIGTIVKANGYREKSRRAIRVLADWQPV